MESSILIISCVFLKQCSPSLNTEMRPLIQSKGIQLKSFLTLLFLRTNLPAPITGSLFLLSDPSSSHFNTTSVTTTQIIMQICSWVSTCTVNTLVMSNGLALRCCPNSLFLDYSQCTCITLLTTQCCPYFRYFEGWMMTLFFFFLNYGHYLGAQVKHCCGWFCAKRDYPLVQCGFRPLSSVWPMGQGQSPEVSALGDVKLQSWRPLQATQMSPIQILWGSGTPAILVTCNQSAAIAS